MRYVKRQKQSIPESNSNLNARIAHGDQSITMALYIKWKTTEIRKTN